MPDTTDRRLWIAAFAAAILATAALTTAVYPHLSPELEQEASGHLFAVAALAGRNGLVLVLYVALVLRVARGASHAEVHR